MTRKRKLLDKLRQNPRNAAYRDLLAAVRACGFVQVRQRGSHELYQHPDHADVRLNLQRFGSRAKAYQVLDFLNKVRQYNLDDV